MVLLSLISLLLLEQLRPLQEREFLLAPLRRVADLVEARFNGGEASHGLLSWLLVMVPPVALALVVGPVLARVNPVLEWLWNVLVLYFTMGFRQFSHFYTDIHLSLRMGDVPRARSLLGQWRGRSADGLNSGEVARLAIETALLECHRHVFAPMLLFVLLPGVSGPVAYLVAEILASAWGKRTDAEFGEFGLVARRAFEWLDWLPRRVTAAGFAVVGDFEDAIWCWRTQAEKWPDRADGIVLSSGAGALGVRLGDPVVEGGELVSRPEIGLGDEADPDIMQGGIGLVWRTLVLWLMLLALLGVASLVGG